MLDLNNQTPLTLSQIATKAPAVVEQNASPRVSKHYVHIPTTVLISDMKKLGWEPVAVDQQRSGGKESNKFAKHMVYFRNPEIVLKTEDGEVVFPQVLMVNSHDGKGAFQFHAGLFRLVCANGLVVSTKDFGSLRIRHRGYSFEMLTETIKDLVGTLPKTVEVLNKFRDIQLDEDQKVKFALEAIGVRFGENGAEVEPLELLKPKREADKGNSLWAVYNILQERIIQGGFEYKTESGRNKTAKKITAFSRDISVNKELFALAETYTS